MLELSDEAASPLPSTLLALREQLKGFVHHVDEEVASDPEAAATGRWWRDRPMNLRPRSWPAVTQTRRAAVLILLWPSESGPQVLLTARGRRLTKHPGEVSFPGGAADDHDADAIATALREAQEETALAPERVEILGTLPPAPVPVSGFMVTPVLAVAEDPGVVAPQSEEVAYVLCQQVRELVDPQYRMTAVVERDGIRLPSPAFRGPGGAPLIWGFTGILLDGLLGRLGWARDWDTTREINPLAD